VCSIGLVALVQPIKQPPGPSTDTNNSEAGVTPRARKQPPCRSMARGGSTNRVPDPQRGAAWRPPGRPKVVVLMPPPVPPGLAPMEHQGHHQQHLLPISPPRRAARCWKPAVRVGHRLEDHHLNFLPPRQRKSGRLLPVTSFGESRPRARRPPARGTSAAQAGVQARSCGLRLSP